MTEWIPGMFYDIGGAAALYWPDQHPEHPIPGQRWVVFDPWGGLEVIMDRPPRDDGPIEREMGLAPFLVPEPEPGREVWQRMRIAPIEDGPPDQHGEQLTVDYIDEPPPQ